MYRSIPLCFFLVLCCMQVFGDDDITIQGTVSDASNTPIAGARVSLKLHPELVALTASDGTFTVRSNTPGIRPVSSKSGHGFAVRMARNGSGFYVRIPEARQLVTIDLFSLDGAKVFSSRYINTRTEDRFIALPRNAGGVYALRVTAGATSRLFTVMTGIDALSLLENRNAAPETGALSRQAADAFVDTLVVYRQGYLTALKGISSYIDSAVSLNLTASNPWTPAAGQLTYSGCMVKIQAKGYDFEMGQPNDTIWGLIDGLTTSEYEQPVHTVTFTRDFWMDTVEVQQGEFDSLMKKNYSNYTNGWSETHGLGDDYPVYCVSWDDAVLFCNARSKRDGYDTVYSYTLISGQPGNIAKVEGIASDLSANGYYLPTEAQWEYACRGGTFTDYYWGKNFNDYQTGPLPPEVDSYAVWMNNSFNLGLGAADFAANVPGKKPPNNYGLYDMIGNLSEWCHDWVSRYCWGSATDPSGPSSPTDENGDYHIIRGGNWGNDITHLRSANRYFEAPDYAYFFYGFRCVRTAE